MVKKITFAFSILLGVWCSELAAQNVYFTGVGRALVSKDQLTDDTKKDSRLLASGGYTLFDLGIYANPNEVLRGGVILRIRNEFGGFFGDGAGFEFRQLQMEGLIDKKVKYEIGDIYLSNTKYTLWNEDFMAQNFESNIFSLRRNIVNYENFYVGNAWRLQGVNAKAKFMFSSGIDTLGVRVFGGRTMETDMLTIPERYFYGGRLDLKQSQYFKISGNVSGISDIAGTVDAAEVEYNNFVYTSDLAFMLDKEKIRFELGGEVGGSHFDLSRSIDSVKHAFDDYFYDAGAKFSYKPLNFNLGVSYRNVGFNFSSPLAQTRRLAAPADVSLTYFPLMNDQLSPRQMSLFDTYAQEKNMYNQSISTTLMNYHMQYNMVEPYGQATPNRKGLTVSADLQDGNDIIKLGFEANMLSEIVSEGDSVTKALRKFSLMQGGFLFKVNKLLKYEKLIALSGSYRSESSVRTETNPLDLKSSLIDVGLDVEVLKDLHVLGGTKMFNVKGSEVQTGRDELNQIISFGTGTLYSQTDKVLAAGLRYDFDKATYFSMHYHNISMSDKITPTNNFKLKQVFFVFGLKF